MSKSSYFSGQRLGKFTLVERQKGGWNCICDCGKIKLIKTFTPLKIGKIVSCGCYKKSKDHGLSQTKLYKVWRGIKNRCENPNTISYKHYGARGIKLCSEWDKSPVAFYEWCQKNGYQEGLEIDRMDINSGYTPENCRFVTKTINNSENKRDLIYLTINGETKSLQEWSKITGLKSSTLYARFKKGYTNNELITVLSSGKRIKGGQIRCVRKANQL